MNQKIIGSNVGEDTRLVYENALLLYVYGRVTLNTNFFLVLLPSIFFLFHHAIEISIKTLLKLKNIKFPYGQKGHRTYKLLGLVINNGNLSEDINDLIKDKDLIDLLKAMDNSYLKNKYEYPGYNLMGIRLRDLVDKIILTLFKEINSILASKVPKHALAILYMPESLKEMFIHKLNLEKVSSFTILRLRED